MWEKTFWICTEITFLSLKKENLREEWKYEKKKDIKTSNWKSKLKSWRSRQNQSGAAKNTDRNIFMTYVHYASMVYESLLVVRIHWLVLFDDEDLNPNNCHNNISYISMNDKNIDQHLNTIDHSLLDLHKWHYPINTDQFESK